MKIDLVAVGKPVDKNFIASIKEYVNRLSHYAQFSFIEIPELKNTKNLSEEQQKQKEEELIMQVVSANDELILLDEHGTEFTSVGFSEYLQKKMNAGGKRLVFLIGGPYGFSPNVYKRANGKVSLSKMTFSHQMIRLIFVEQIYRAFTILKGEPYHHE